MFQKIIPLTSFAILKWWQLGDFKISEQTLKQFEKPNWPIGTIFLWTKTFSVRCYVYFKWVFFFIRMGILCSATFWNYFFLEELQHYSKILIKNVGCNYGINTRTAFFWSVVIILFSYLIKPCFCSNSFQNPWVDSSCPLLRHRIISKCQTSKYRRTTLPQT